MNLKGALVIGMMTSLAAYSDWNWKLFKSNVLIDLPQSKTAFFEGSKQGNILGKLEYKLSDSEADAFARLSAVEKYNVFEIKKLPEGLKPVVESSELSLTLSFAGSAKRHAVADTTPATVKISLNGKTHTKTVDFIFHDVETNWTSPITGKSYSLIFNDEFNGKTVNKDRWNYRHEVSKPITRTIKFNDKPIEVHCRKECSVVENGSMTLKVERDEQNGNIINTGGLFSSQTFQPRYGYYETKVDFSKCSGWGYWPAFWLYFDAQYRDSTGTEIDIFELIPAQKKIYQTLHWYENLPNSVKDKHLRNFHTTDFPDIRKPAIFGLEWTPTELIFYINGKVSKHLKKSDNDRFVPSAFQFVCYSMSAGEWGGNVADPANVLPAATSFDYCRVFQQPEQKYLFKKPASQKWGVKKARFTESAYFDQTDKKVKFLTGNPDEVSETANE